MVENSFTYELSKIQSIALLNSDERKYIGELMGYPWFISFGIDYSTVDRVAMYLQTYIPPRGERRIVYVHLLYNNETKVEQSYYYPSGVGSQIIYYFDISGDDDFQFKIILHQQNNDADIPVSSNLPPESISEMQPSIKQSKISQLNDLSQDFQARLLDDHLSDVTIRCHSSIQSSNSNLQPPIFKAHKVILSSRSPVFNAMFSHPLVENTTDTITIVDMDAEVVKALINFIYSGQVDIQSISEATCLLNAAEKYQIHSLKKGLIEYIKSVISEENAFELLELADLYDVNLKEYVIEFIGKHFNKMKQMKEWNEIKSSKPILAVELYSYLDCEYGFRC